ncbi:MAG: hypothetical protein R6X33_06190 [Candidatus Brocadiia bacterium]
MSGKLRGWLAQMKFVLLLALVVLVLIVVFQNLEVVRYRVIFWEVPLPGFLLPTAAFVAGLIAGALAMHLVKRRSRP